MIETNKETTSNNEFNLGTVEEWLGNDPLKIDIFNQKYLDQNETFPQWLYRVSGGDKQVATAIYNRQFLFGGRILHNRGKHKATMMNCYSEGFIEDDYKQILESMTRIGLVYKSEGGEGISLSKLRPKGSPIGDRYESDGIIPFMEMYNAVTKGTSQGGSRKGALLISLDAWHKESKDFINLKSKDDVMTKANLSLEVDDDFMKDVKEYYAYKRENVREISREYSGHSVSYKISPIELYKNLIQMNFDWGEPGCLFVDRFRNYHIMEFDNNYKIETCNPCTEQPLPKHGACCLGSINISELVTNPYTPNANFDYQKFSSLISMGIRALDQIIDENMERHALKESAEVSYNYRNVGLGVFGYASMLMKMGIKYGSPEALDITEDIFMRMFRTAVVESNHLAIEKGSFPKYSEAVWQSRIIKKHFNELEIADLKKHGLRNCSLLSIAPTGSIATMLGETGGIEPEFALKFTRKTESLNKSEEKFYDVYCKSAAQYIEKYRTSELPDYFLTSADIHWEDRLMTQSVIQEHIDTAISSTVNLPEETTLEDMEMLYLRAWELGLKGVTVFRSGCKRFPILKTDKETKSQFDEPKTEENEQNIAYNSIKPTSRKTLGTTNGNTYCKKTACGTLYITINRDQDGHVVECFVNTSKGGICQATVNGLNRMISLAMRAGVELDEIVDQLKGITCMACAKRRDLDGISCPDIIGRTIEEFTKTNFQTIIKEPPIAETIKSKVKIIQMQEIPTVMCPECGSQMANMEGCVTCLTCGFSKCG